MTNPSITFPSNTVQSSGQLRDEFEASPIGDYAVDADGMIREVNDAGCQLLGLARGELVGRFGWDFVVDERRDAAREEYFRKIARQQQLTVINYECRHADGSYLWLETHEKLIEGSAGKVTGIRFAVLDITDRHKFEQEIQKQHDRMRLLLRSIGSAIVSADALGYVDFMNPAAEKLTGWTHRDATGRAIEEVCRVIRDNGEGVDLMSCLLADGVVSNPNREFAIIDRSGASHKVRWNLSPISNDEGIVAGLALVLKKH